MLICFLIRLKYLRTAKDCKTYGVERKIHALAIKMLMAHERPSSIDLEGSSIHFDC